MKVKVLFLDIDGVLNSNEHDKTMPNGKAGHAPGLWEDATQDIVRWCPMMLARLRRIVARTDCRIVISSNWRVHYPPAHMVWKWKQMFGVYGWTDAPVIGATLKLPQKFGQVLNGEQTFRGEEVRLWIKEYGPVPAYVCLDDHENFYPKQPLVQTDPDVGLQDEQVERCIEILNRVDPE